MAQRTPAELLLLYADNTTGEISPQDLRDFVDSVEAPHGRVHMTTPAPTTITTPGTFVKAQGTWGVSGMTHAVTPTTTGRMTYTGTKQRHFHIVCNAAIRCASDNQVIGIGAGIGGIVDPDSIMRQTIGTGTDYHTMVIHADEHLDINDYIEVFVTNYTSTAAVTVEDCYFFIMGMF